MQVKRKEIQMNIAIIGLGAIGSLWAVKLCQQGHNVIGFTRHASDTHASITLDGQCHTIRTNQAERLKQCQLVLVTVKSTQIHSAMPPLLPFISADTAVVFLHNGMGAIDNIQTDLNLKHCYLATTTQAAFRPQPNEVQHTGQGQTLIGPTSADTRALTPSLLAQLEQAFAPVIWQADIANALWHKLAINCVINPLTALHQCRNGQLSHPDYQVKISQLITEIHQVMQAVSIDTNQQQLSKTVYAVIDSTANNYSSMQQDIAHQRPTEIDFITGYLIKVANLYHISLPHNLALYQAIKKLEAELI